MATMTLAPTAHHPHPHSGSYHVNLNQNSTIQPHQPREPHIHQQQQHHYFSHSVMEDSDDEEDAEGEEDEDVEDDVRWDPVAGARQVQYQHHVDEEEDDNDAIQSEIEASHQYYANHPNPTQTLQQQQYGYQNQYSYQQQQQQLMASHGLDDQDGLEDEEQYSDDDESSTASIPDENIDFSLIYALRTFLATVEGQASVVKGDSLLLLDDANSYWWLVRVLKTEDVGYIPAENVETPFERLARLNKHRNIEVTLATLEDKAAAGGPRGNVVDGVRERDKDNGSGGIGIGKEKERKGLLSWSKKKAESDVSASRRVIFAPPTYVEHPGVTWSSDEEDEEGDEEEEEEDEEDEDALENEVDGEHVGGEGHDQRGKDMIGSMGQEGQVAGYDLEPDDGVEWAHDAVKAQRMESEYAPRLQQQQQQRQQQQQQEAPQAQLQQQQQRDAQVAQVTTPESGQSRPIPTTIITPSTPQTSSTAKSTSAPITSPETVSSQPVKPSPPLNSRNPFSPNYTPPKPLTSSTSSSSLRIINNNNITSKPMAYTRNFSLPLVTSLIRARAISSLPTSSRSSSAQPNHQKSMSQAMSFHLLDDVQKELYGERAEMEGVHPEIRSCFATLCARMDAWDREVDEIVGSVGVIGGIVQEQHRIQHHQQQQRRYSQRIGVI